MESGAGRGERKPRGALAQRGEGGAVRAGFAGVGGEGEGEQVRAAPALRPQHRGVHRPPGPRRLGRLPQHQDSGAAMSKQSRRGPKVGAQHAAPVPAHPISRREFVGDVASGLAFTIVPPHVLGARGRNRLAPSDKLNIACIGVGGMGANDVRGVGKTENIYALGDVDDRQGAQSFSAFPLAKRFKDFRVMLEKEGKNIDAVTVSTPDHTHTVAGMMAMKLGKHTRIQKPLARTLWEVKQLEDAARRYKVATQMGNQGHAEEGTRLMREWVEAGAIGTVREIQLWTNRPIWPQAIERPLDEFYTPSTLDWDLWLGPAPARPYHPAYAPFRWRGWWDFGSGGLGDMGIHNLAPVFSALKLGAPESITASSTPVFEETVPLAACVHYQFPARGKMPPVKLHWYDGGLLP